MAKYITEITGNIDEFTRYLEREVLISKNFTTIKHQFRTKINDVQCCVQVFEGYTFWGGNWLTMDVTTLEYEGKLKVVVITSGGSNALLLKNFSLGIEGENKMLNTAREIIGCYRPIQLAQD